MPHQKSVVWFQTVERTAMSHISSTFSSYHLYLGSKVPWSVSDSAIYSDHRTASLSTHPCHPVDQLARSTRCWPSPRVMRLNLSAWRLLRSPCGSRVGDAWSSKLSVRSLRSCLNLACLGFHLLSRSRCSLSVGWPMALSGQLRPLSVVKALICVACLFRSPLAVCLYVW